MKKYVIYTIDGGSFECDEWNIDDVSGRVNFRIGEDWGMIMHSQMRYILPYVVE